MDETDGEFASNKREKELYGEVPIQMRCLIARQPTFVAFLVGAVEKNIGNCEISTCLVFRRGAS